MSALTIDTDDFTRRGDAESGSVAVAELERLTSLLVSDAGELSWRLEGGRQPRSDGGTDSLLRLHERARVTMRCVRCLESVEVPVAVDRLFKVVDSEDIAEREDPDEDRFDLIARSRRLDVRELIEDEAILALPLAPRHEDCEAPPNVAAADEVVEERENPFAALARLKSKPDDERR